MCIRDRVSRLLALIGSWLPQGYADAVRQIGLFVIADLLYETVRGLAEGRRSVAFANGQAIRDREKATGTFFEPGFQAFFISSPFVLDLANFLYMNTHFVLTTTFLVWLYFSVSYTHLRAHETVLDLVCRLLLEKKK